MLPGLFARAPSSNVTPCECPYSCYTCTCIRCKNLFVHKLKLCSFARKLPSLASKAGDPVQLSVHSCQEEYEKKLMKERTGKTVHCEFYNILQTESASFLRFTSSRRRKWALLGKNGANKRKTHPKATNPIHSNEQNPIHSQSFPAVLS